MVNIIKEELSLEESLRKKIEFICDFTNNKPTIINGSIRKIDKTNLSYIEPHKIIVKNTTFLAFNYSTDIYVGSLNKKIQLVELEDYIKNLLNAWYFANYWLFKTKQLKEVFLNVLIGVIHYGKKNIKIIKILKNYI